MGRKFRGESLVPWQRAVTEELRRLEKGLGLHTPSAVKRMLLRKWLMVPYHTAGRGLTSTLTLRMLPFAALPGVPVKMVLLTDEALAEGTLIQGVGPFSR